MEIIEEDLQELAGKYPKLHRLTVANGDPFALPTGKLLEISELIRKYLPNINVITCTTSIRNIMKKSQKELDQLYEAKYNDIYIGIESGCDDVLKLLNKGITINDTYETLEKLEKSNIRYIALLMGGAGGKQYREENIIDTVKLLNKYPPKMISIITTGIPSGTTLSKMRDDGKFVQLTEREVIEDELALIEALDMPDGVYFYGHHRNNVARVSGHFKYKDRLINGFKEKLMYLEENKPEVLDISLEREYL